MKRRDFINLTAAGAAALALVGKPGSSRAFDMLLEDCRDLQRFDWFEAGPDGKLLLSDGVADEIIDFHTHIGLSFLATPHVDLGRRDEDPLTFFPVEGNPIDLSLYAADSFTEENAKTARKESVRQAYSIRGYASTHTPLNLLDMMDRTRVSKSVILAIDYPDGLSHNTKHYLKCSEMYDRLITFCSVHPHDAQVERKTLKFKEKGAVGMKLHPPNQLVRANNKKCMELTKMCGEIGLPCLFHSGHSPLSPQSLADYPAIKHFWEPVEKQPDTTFILAHGGMNMYKELIDLAVRHENVIIELSGQAPGPISEMIEAGLEDRMLFGSDWPYYVEALPLAKVLIGTEGKPEARKKILYDNGARLFEQMGVST